LSRGHFRTIANPPLNASMMIMCAMKTEQCMAKFRAVIGMVIGAGAACAQDFPGRPIRIVVPFPPGGAADIIGRTLAQPLTRSLGQGIVVENRAGANTAIGAEIVARAPADGHTLLVIAPSFTINPYVRAKLPYDTFKDFSGVTRCVSNAIVIAVHPSLPAKSVRELIAFARPRPGELTFATASILGGQRIAGELFRETVGINIVNVPYNGGAPATTAAMGGHTSMLVSNVVESAPQVLAGRLRGIAVTSLARTNVLPDVPTVAESGYPGFEALNWFGVVARAGPRLAIDRLNADIVRAMELPEVKDQMARQGMQPAPMSPDAYDAFLRAEGQRNERIIKSLKLKIE
jgi:tripartite-type tricarboxylate transporter receptor subunit TctC